MLIGMNILGRLRKKLQRSNKRAKIAWVGLDHAGKTSLVHFLMTGEVNTPNLPVTIGINVDKFYFETDEKIEIAIWDLAGQAIYRDLLWNNYLENVNGLIFVIDSAAPDRFDEAKDELWTRFLKNQNFEPIPILILANKQDLPEAVESGIIAQKLNLHTVKSHSYSIMPCSAKSGQNVQEAMTWLVDRILKNLA